MGNYLNQVLVMLGNRIVIHLFLSANSSPGVRKKCIVHKLTKAIVQ